VSAFSEILAKWRGVRRRGASYRGGPGGQARAGPERMRYHASREPSRPSLRAARRGPRTARCARARVLPAVARLLGRVGGVSRRLPWGSVARPTGREAPRGPQPRAYARCASCAPSG